MTIAPEHLRSIDELDVDLSRDLPADPFESAAPSGTEPGGTGTNLDSAPSGKSVNPALVAAATFLATAAAGWMVGGMFRNALIARALCLAGAAIGVGVIHLSHRLLRAGVLPYAVIPLAALAGAAAVAPEATGGTANLPGLVADALRAGGLRQPPVAFDPGWRFILVVLFAVIGAGALANAVRMARPRIGVVVPGVVTLGAAVIQPPGHELVASTVAIFLVVAGFAVAYGADMAADGAVGAKYEMRRLARGVALLVALMAAMLGMARLGFLFPDTQEDKVLPPQKPPQAPLEKDRELFRVKSPRPGPWRVGTLDVYDGKSWLLPPYDPRRVKPMVNASGVQTYKAEFDLVDVRGHNLPVPANVLAVRGDAKPEYDPRTQVPRLPSRIPRHFRYTAEAVVPPNGKDMNASPPPNAKVAAEFGRIPAAPGEVLALLADAPTVPFDRMQFLRDRLYANVVAAGSGQPVDVTPARVAQMLQPNAEATPYEITAAEAMLARWAGVPSRIGFGFHGGDPLPDGTSSFRPRHGAAWMEAYFEGFGWVPLVGTPPRAKSSLTADQKNDDPRVKPTDDLAMVLYLPARRLTFKLLYEIVRYWVLVLLPFALLGLAVVVLAPWLTKQARRVRRRRWGAGRGPIGQTLAAYAELRDRCHDLNLGDVRSSPLEFVDSFAPDGEHDELGWLVTRVLWGDLRRDVRAEDAAACGEMCRSVWRRMVSEQTPVNRFLGAVSRASLRDPYSDDVPNLWVSWSLGRGLRKLGRQARRVGRSLTPRRLAEARGAAMLLVVVLLLTTLTGCVRQGGLTGATVAVRLPAVLPSQTLLGYGVQPEPAVEAKYRAKSKTKLLVDDGRVVTFHEGHITQGALQVALFKPEVDSQDPGIQRDVEKSIAGTFTTYRFGTVRVRLHESPQQRIFLWFPPDSNTMEVFVMRKQFADALRVVRAAIAQQRGLSPELLAGRTLLPVPPPAPDAPVPPSSPGSSPGSPGSASAFPAGAASGATP